MSTLYLGHFVQFFDDNGDPLSGGEVTFYEPGTSTKKDVYTTSALTTPASNPVTLDSAGRSTIFLNGDYKARLEKSDGSLVDETDNINPPLDTETSGGNLVANGSFETAGNASTDADGWTLTAQSDGSVERITTDNYDGEAALKFTSDGSGGGQADTNAFFAVSPGRTYGISFALKCSVADIRNIVQVRYFDSSQSFISASTVYDEDTSNPTSWEIKRFTDTPPSTARFAKFRILGADQSDATAGEAKFDSIVVGLGVGSSITATSDQANAVLTPYATARVELGGDYDAGEEMVCERIGNTVTITSVGQTLSHTNTSNPAASSGAIPSAFRPTTRATNMHTGEDADRIETVRVWPTGNLGVTYREYSTGGFSSKTAGAKFTITYLIEDNIT